MVYNRLIWKDNKGEIHPDLADEWAVSDDGLSMTLKLNADAVWHDGKPVVAGDFVEMYGYTTDTALQEFSGPQKLAGLLKSFSGVEAVDDKTLMLTFPQPVPFVYDLLDYWYALLIPDKTDGRLFNKLANGTGPFKMAEFKVDEYAKFEQVSGYFKGDSTLSAVIIKLLAPETLIPNLESGAIHAVKKINASDFDYIKGLDGYDVMINEGSGGINNIIVNTKKAPLNDVRVRQAISYALDRETINQEIFYGVNSATSAPFYSEASIAYTKEMKDYYKFDLEKAKALLDEAGAGEFELNIIGWTALPEWTLYLQVWQADLKKIGVTLNITEFETAEFYEAARDPDLQGNHMAVWGTGRTKRDPAIFFQTQQQYFGGPADSSYVNPYGWVSADMNDAVVAAMVELDPAKRAELYKKANEILTTELPMINITSNNQLMAFNTKVKGLEADLLGFWMYDKASIEA
jgi:ABC-type transport system substrate-binding protein